jgi:hypothetical protein
VSRLIINTNMTADAVIDVGEWFVSEGSSIAGLIDELDSGVTLLRYQPVAGS